MRIGVIGGGRVGGGLARVWERAGHEVRVATRADVAETALFGDVVVLAVPAGEVEAAVQAAGPLDGRVLLDATNDLSRIGPGTAGIAALAPGARVVKSFNTVFAALYDQVLAADSAPSLVLCGDDAPAKQAVSTLARDAGYEPIDVGGLEHAGLLDALAGLVTGLAYRQGRGPFVYRFEAP
jgi:8-hydroxy-5-deazaflavin:NADPH oxidoreductase